MKLRFSGITLGFFLTGLVLGFLDDLVTFAYGFSGDAVQRLISDQEHWMIWLCPPSIGWISFDNNAATSEIVEMYMTVPLLNALIYGAAGLAISQIYHLSKRFMGPKAA